MEAPLTPTLSPQERGEGADRARCRAALKPEIYSRAHDVERDDDVADDVVILNSGRVAVMETCATLKSGGVDLRQHLGVF